MPRDFCDGILDVLEGLVIGQIVAFPKRQTDFRNGGIVFHQERGGGWLITDQIDGHLGCFPGTIRVACVQPQQGKRAVGHDFLDPANLFGLRRIDQQRLNLFKRLAGRPSTAHPQQALPLF
jgi:hypothetical protein